MPGPTSAAALFALRGRWSARIVAWWYVVLYPLGRRRRAEGRFRGFCGGSGTTGVVKVWDADGCLRAAAGPHRPRPTVERERDRHGATGVTEIDDNG